MVEEWKKNYDRINIGWDGELVVFGGHYNLKQCLEIIEHDKYDDSKEWENSVVEHQYAKHGVFTHEGEKIRGWMCYPDYKKGRVLVSILTKQIDDIATKKVLDEINKRYP